MVSFAAADLGEAAPAAATASDHNNDGRGEQSEAGQPLESQRVQDLLLACAC